MKVVILAAGRGERMNLLTMNTPKPLLKVNGKPIIDYIFDALPEEIDEAIVVVKYLGDKIVDYLGTRRNGIKIKYVEGSDTGNANSFFATRKHLRGERFLLIYGDEIPNPENIKKCLNEGLSVITFNEGTIDGIMVLDTSIFKYKPKGLEFKSLVEKFVKYKKVALIEDENFIGGINTPEDIIRVEEKLNG